MRFDDLQKKVLAVLDRYQEENEITLNEDYAILKLVEEVGEFAQAVIIQRGLSRASKRLPSREAQANVASELADILGLTILVADRIGVDLEGAVREKWFKFLARGAVQRKRTPTSPTSVRSAAGGGAPPASTPRTRRTVARTGSRGRRRASIA